MPATNFKLAEAPVPMVYATHRTIRDCNDEFAALFGYARDELVDAGFQELYPRFSDYVRVGREWQRNFGGGTVYYDERIMRRKDQSRFWCKVHGRSRTPRDPFAEAIYCFEPMARPVGGLDAALTERQLQIVAWVAQGKTNHAIAQIAGISSRTVEAHRARIMRTVGVANTAELIAWFESGRAKTGRR